MSVSRTEITRLSKKYAIALYSLASEEGNIKKISDSLNSINNAIKISSELRSVIANPVILKGDLHAVFDEICKKTKAHKVVVSFCNMLVENNRMGIFSYIVEAFQDIISEASGEVKVSVVSAKEISEIEISKISKSIEKSISKKPIITSKIDEEIIGGLIINIGSKMLDASVQGRLHKMKNNLKKYSL